MKIQPVHKLFWFKKDERFEREKKRAERTMNIIFASSSCEHIPDNRYNDLRFRSNRVPTPLDKDEK